MTAQNELEALYIPYHGQHQYTHQISKGAWYLGEFSGFGDVFAKHWMWRNPAAGKPAAPLFRSQAFQEKALDAALAANKLQNTLVFSTTPTYYSQFQSACPLRSRGFELLQGKCYAHPNYGDKSSYNPEHPGIPDRYQHWEHIWWKINGKPPKVLGAPTDVNKLNNCGVDSVTGLDSIHAHDSGGCDCDYDDDCDHQGDRKDYLAVAWLKRGTAFPAGWQRFYSAEDYKLGVNFNFVEKQRGSKVQICPHDFDLKIFEGWGPDFKKWAPV